MSKRRVLLIEPNYKNKYPPMGLMKLAMYYRLQGDDVTFWKGDFTDFVIEELYKDFFRRIETAEACVGDEGRSVFDLSRLRMETPSIKTYIRTGKIIPDSCLERLIETTPILSGWLQEYRTRYKTKWYFEEPRWDLVCVTTLFTFYWDITIETIEFAKRICKDWKRNVQVGGVLASVVPERVLARTGVKPHCGILSITHFSGDKVLPAPFAKTAIDALPLDYSLLDETDYQYPEIDAFYGYATRGCVNRCPFCVVPVLEPEYRDFIPLKQRIAYTTNVFGEQRNLLLLDNNVFASARFDKIIDDIKSCGFGRNDKYKRPNQLKIAARQLQRGWNERAYLRRIVRLLSEYRDWVEHHESEERYNRLYSLLSNNGLLHDYTATKAGALTVCDEICEEYDQWHKKRTHPIVRIVDFNQGLDARLATPEKMRKLSEIAIRPLRIAFDDWKFRSYYVRAIKLGSDYGIVNSSNYLLYNFKDTPDDLYNRLLINIDLCDALGVNVYSFPMKYHPIKDPNYFSNRDYIGEHWNRKFIRAIQSVLNSTHGKIGRGRTFFFKAFGRNLDEFHDLLYLPEAFIIKRWDAEIGGYKADWLKARKAMSAKERNVAERIVEKNVFDADEINKLPVRVAQFLSFYLIPREEIDDVSEEDKARYIAAFEASCNMEVSDTCRELLSQCGWQG